MLSTRFIALTQEQFGEVDAVDRALVLLADHPLAAKAGRIDGTRELVLRRMPYVVAYRVSGDMVQVLAVRHTARDWPEMF